MYSWPTATAEHLTPVFLFPGYALLLNYVPTVINLESNEGTVTFELLANELMGFWNWMYQIIWCATFLPLMQNPQKVKFEYFGTSKLLLIHTLLRRAANNTFLGTTFCTLYDIHFYVFLVLLRGDDQRVKTRITHLTVLNVKALTRLAEYHNYCLWQIWNVDSGGLRGTKGMCGISYAYNLVCRKTCKLSYCTCPTGSR